jgi:predicted peptidase
MEAIAGMRRKIAALGDIFEPRAYGDSARRMPFRLFRASASSGGKVPLILYLHGAGGLGNDNTKQIRGGNLFGSHLWALPENQRRFPCYIVAPQTSFGWIRYDGPRTPDGPRPKAVPGLGEGAGIVLGIVSLLMKEFPIDASRIYVMGNSMGGGGTWHILAHRSDLFAAGVPVAAGATADDPAAALKVPVWNFHGDADQTVSVEISRTRISALRKAGGAPLYTEYPGVGHNACDWAFTEPALIDWLFAQKKG